MSKTGIDESIADSVEVLRAVDVRGPAVSGREAQAWIRFWLRIREPFFRFLPSCIFVTCALLIWPVVESGVMDDWSIVRTSQVLANTGKFSFNGWESPVLGWLPFAGALVIKTFGFSYTALRLLMIAVSTLVVFIFGRLSVLAGIREPYAILGSVALAVSPIFLTAGLTFMSDMPGVLAIVVCLYACMRAVKANSENAAICWLATASISNAVLGSVRQTAWLGLFVMAPCALWLLRRQRAPLLAGGVAWCAAAGMVISILHWFGRQPYVLPVKLIPGQLSPGVLLRAPAVVGRSGLELLLLILPIPLSFLAILRWPGIRKSRITLISACVSMVLFLACLHLSSDRPLAPYLMFGAFQQTLDNVFLDFPVPMVGPAPWPLTRPLRLGCTLLVLLSAVALLHLYLHRKQLRRLTGAEPALFSWHEVLVLVVPFSVAYCAVILPRGLFIYMVDRYLLPLMPVAILLLAGLVQRYVSVRSLRFAFAALCLVAVYSVTSLHDAFAVYRVNLRAIDEVRATGVERTAIDGGTEYNLSSEIVANGFVPFPGIRLPDGTVQPMPAARVSGACDSPFLELTPAVKPVYSIAFAGSGCRRAAGFKPMYFKTWLWPREHSVEVVLTGAASSY